MNMGAEKYTSLPSLDFVSSDDKTFEHFLGADTSTSDQNKKMAKLVDTYKELNNIIIKIGDKNAISDQMHKMGADIESLQSKDSAG